MATKVHEGIVVIFEDTSHHRYLVMNTSIQIPSVNNISNPVLVTDAVIHIDGTNMIITGKFHKRFWHDDYFGIEDNTKMHSLDPAKYHINMMEGRTKNDLKEYAYLVDGDLYADEIPLTKKQIIKNFFLKLFKKKLIKPITITRLVSKWYFLREYAVSKFIIKDWVLQVSGAEGIDKEELAIRDDYGKTSNISHKISA